MILEQSNKCHSLSGQRFGEQDSSDELRYVAVRGDATTFLSAASAMMDLSVDLDGLGSHQP